MPICKASKCVLKRTVENALYFATSGHLLTPNSTLEHDQLINIRCLPGFSLKGANAIRCYLGELSAVYVHEVDFRNKACANCARTNDDETQWPVCKPETERNSLSNIDDWNLERREIELMIADDLEELKKLNRNRNRNEIKPFRQTWCPKPTRLKSLLKHIDKLRSVNQLKSRLIGIVELDHGSKKTRLASSKKTIYPPGSQLLYRCINDRSDWLFNNNILIKNVTADFNQKSSWLLTCSKDGAWIGKRVPCPEKNLDELI